jgi:hypothetical protein
MPALPGIFKGEDLIMPNTKVSESLALVGRQNGVVIIPAGTPLTRLNYFDGKFLRASDLKAEQEYLRQLVGQSNQAGGTGVAYGYDVTLGDGDILDIGPGLAIDAQGRVLLLPRETSISIRELIDKSRALQDLFSASQVQSDGGFGPCQLSIAAPAVSPLAASDLFAITISAAEALCGEEDVFGNLCEEACVTSTDRPFVVEGLIVRAVPLALQTPLPNSKAFPLTGLHLRSRVASAYFEDERRRVASLISKAGLEQMVWCLGADAEGGGGVPIGVIAREGSGTIFLDPWIARRERIDAPAKRYWQWRMMMRPWDVFLAQVLQFQCQLHDLFKNLPAPGGDGDPCGGARGAISEAAVTIAELRQFFEFATQRFTTLQAPLDEAVTFKGGVSRLTTLNAKLLEVESALAVAPQDRLLIHGGIVELPSAGYLPVMPGAGLTINQQVRRIMGEGVDLRFCLTSPDYVAHALEEAQHMERISLLQGLDDPQNKPRVEILVPNGEIVTQQTLSPGRGFEAIVDLNPALFSSPSPSPAPAPAPSPGPTIPVSLLNPSIRFNGAARTERQPSGGAAAYISAEYVIRRVVATPIDRPGPATQPGGGIDIGGAIGAGAAKADSVFDRANQAAVVNNQRAGLWVSLQCERNVFELKRGDTTNFNARAVVGATTDKAPLLDVELDGVLRITQETIRNGGAQSLKGRIEKARLSFLGEAFDNTGDNTGPGKTTLIDLDATVTMTGGSAIEIALTNQQNQFDLSANWGKQPMEVRADIKTSPKGADGPARETVLAEAALKENPDVLSDKNAGHIHALDALEVVAATLNDADFADAKARLLFPPPPKPTDELIVRGVLDWVLFHRRRAEQCGVDVKAPAVAPSRRYQVYHMAAIDAEHLKQAREALQKNDAAILSRLEFVPVAVVEFAGGVAALLSDPADLKTDWQAVKPGNFLAYEAIASAGSAAEEGAALALRRLDRVEGAISSVSHPGTGTISEALPVVPTRLAVSGTDGVIVLITGTIVQSVCHTVARVRPDAFDNVIQQAEQGNFDTIFGQQLAVKLGNVQFKSDSAEVLENSLDPIVAQWAALGGGVPEAAIVVSRQVDSSQAIGAQVQQAQKIQEALDGTVTPRPLFSAKPIPECPVITFITFTEIADATPCTTGPNPLILTSITGQSPTGRVTINNNSNAPFSVLGLSANSPFLVLTTVPAGGIQINPGASLAVDILYRLIDPNPIEDRGTLVITTNVPGLTCPSVQLIGRRPNLGGDAIEPPAPQPGRATGGKPEASAPREGMQPRIVKKKPHK